MIGIVEGIDVNGKSLAMLRNGMGVRDEAEVEARGVVVPHRPLVVGIPVVDESHSLYRIFRLVELFENIEHICRNRLVYHHFTYDVSAVLIHM